MAGPRLKRTLGLFDSVMINLGAIIGAGIFVVIGIAVDRAGPSIIVSLLLGAAIAVLTGLSFSEIALHVTKEGGVYEFAKETIGSFPGFMSGWTWNIGNIILVSAVLISMGSYINALFGTHIAVYYFAIPGLVLFTAINMLGMRNSAKTIRWLVFVNIAALLIFVAAGSFFFKAGNFSAFMPNGISGTLAGTAIIFFAFTGFSRIATVAGEVKDPKRNVSRAILISIVASTILYLAVAAVAVGMLNYVSLGHSASPLSSAISIIGSPALDIAIALGGVAATAGVAFTGILGVSRVYFAMGRDNKLPRTFGRLNRFATPGNAILLTSLMTAMFILFVNFGLIVRLADAGVLVAYGIINIAAFRMSTKKKGSDFIRSRYFPVIPVLGLISVATLVAYLGYETILITALILVAGAAFYTLWNRGRHGKVPRISAVRTFGPSRHSTAQ